MAGDRQAVGLVALAVLGLIACGGKSARSRGTADARDAGSAAAAGSESRHARAGAGGEGASTQTGGAAGGANASSGADAGGGAALGGAAGAGGAANTGGSTGDGGSVSAGAGGRDSTAPGATTFALRNDGDAPIYVQVEFRQWLWVAVDGEDVILDSDCWCAEAQACFVSEPPLPLVTEIPPGDSYTHAWDGYAAVWKDTCYERTVLRGDYEARFCYGTSVSPSAGGFGDVVDDPRCRTVAFELGDESVELRVVEPHPTTQ